MKQSTRKAISRFRKLQDKVFNKQVEGCKVCDIMTSTFNNGLNDVTYISIFLHNAPRACKSWTIYLDTTEAELEKIFREASEYINYQI